MSGGPPPQYGFSGGNPYYQSGPQGGPPTHFPSAPYPGVPQPHVQRPGAPPSYFHPPQHFPLPNSNYYPVGETHFTSAPQTTSNYFPAGETHFTSSFVPQSNAHNTSQGPKWVQWQKGNMLPAHAVEAGYDVDRTKIYVGRLNYKGDLLPAKVIPQKSVAYVAHNGSEIPFHSCEILCHPYVNWVKESNGRVPPGATAVGRTSSGETLYAARVHHNGSLTVGKVHPSHGVCYIPFGGKEIAHRDYEVLIS